MTEVICVWESPRSRGTAISYALYNGLTEMGYRCLFWDEPFHFGHLKSIEVSGGAKKAHIQSVKYPDINIDFIIQKHQAKQIFDERTKDDIGSEMEWIRNFRNILLFRDPCEMVQSHQKALSVSGRSLTFNQIGIEQLYNVLRYLQTCADSNRYVLVDSNELLISPKAGLEHLTKSLGIPFSESMIHWKNANIQAPVWGKHWYDAIMSSHGLHPYTKNPSAILTDPILEDLVMRTTEIIEQMKNQQLRFPHLTSVPNVPFKPSI